MQALHRAQGRLAHQLRPLSISYHVFGYAPGSVLFELGNTKVLCSVSLQPGVPQFLKGKKEGWLTAEYALLPTSTAFRSSRDSQHKRNDRAIEISRLIGRSLRAVVDLTTIGERTIVVDCDVLQADGSTRTAAITGAYLALSQAMQTWIANKEIQVPFLKEAIAAVSVGCREGNVFVDLDYAEDSQFDVDYNVVLTRSGNIIEIQGTAERVPLAWDDFALLMDAARLAVHDLFTRIDEFHDKKERKGASKIADEHGSSVSKIPLFSLQSRFKSATIDAP